jgi:hypothetical protein
MGEVPGLLGTVGQAAVDPVAQFRGQMPFHILR